MLFMDFWAQKVAAGTATFDDLPDYLNADVVAQMPNLEGTPEEFMTSLGYFELANGAWQKGRQSHDAGSASGGGYGGGRVTANRGGGYGRGGEAAAAAWSYGLVNWKIG